jgi:hypothetical protein
MRGSSKSQYQTNQPNCSVHTDGPGLGSMVKLSVFHNLWEVPNYYSESKLLSKPLRIYIGHRKFLSLLISALEAAYIFPSNYLSRTTKCHCPRKSTKKGMKILIPMNDSSSKRHQNGWKSDILYQQHTKSLKKGYFKYHK